MNKIYFFKKLKNAISPNPKGDLSCTITSLTLLDFKNQQTIRNVEVNLQNIYYFIKVNHTVSN